MVIYVGLKFASKAAQCLKGFKLIHIRGWKAVLLDGDVKLDVG